MNCQKILTGTQKKFILRIAKLNNLSTLKSFIDL